MVLTCTQDKTIFQHLIHTGLLEPDDGSSTIKNSLLAHNITRFTQFYSKSPASIKNLTKADSHGAPSQVRLKLGPRGLRTKKTFTTMFATMFPLAT